MPNTAEMINRNIPTSQNVWPTVAMSAVARAPPSALLTTITAVAPSVSGKVRAASRAARADSAVPGRKAAWSEFVTSPMPGAKNMIAAAAANHPATTNHGRAETSRAILPNIVPPSGRDLGAQRSPGRGVRRGTV